MSGDLVEKVAAAIADHLDGGTVSYPRASRAAIAAVAEWVSEHHQMDKDGAVHLALTWQYTKRAEGSK